MTSVRAGTQPSTEPGLVLREASVDELAEVLETVGAAWIAAGRTVQHVAPHVAPHLTVSVNGPAVPFALR